MLVHLPLLNVEFSRVMISYKCVQQLLQIVTFDIYPPLELLSPLSLPEHNEDYSSVYVTPRFEETGYDQLYLVSNLGITFLILLGMLLLSLLLCLTKRIKKLPQKLLTKRENLLKSMYWNSYIRFIVEGTLEIFISAGINFKYLFDSGVNPFDPSQGGWQFRIVNTACLIVLSLVIMVSPVFVAWFYIRNKDKWLVSEEDSEEKQEEQERFE